MGKPPAVVIIARHGARLDQADRQWHLTSPTPYDPPLTYGGWTQSRALGARIASLLRAREDLSLDTPNINNGLTPAHPSLGVPCAGTQTGTEASHPRHTHARRKKHRVIIHTSPFLRCVQTGIAVSAGMSEYNRTKGTNVKQQQQQQNPLKPSSTESKPPSSSNSTGLAVIPEPENQQTQKSPSLQPKVKRAPKSCLRIDAFLGEWLSPDYFEKITPPPSSVMMVAGAKAELLRREEEIQTPVEPGRKSHVGHFPGGWGHHNDHGHHHRKGHALERPKTGDDEDQSKPTTAMGAALGQRNRAGSESDTRVQYGGQRLSRLATSFGADGEGYVPPTPTYAISPSSPIPAGYVSHACEACVDVDYQWDSMRERQDWGNGGEYGEEWSSMHLRFRNGLQKMIDWYKTIDRPHKHHGNHHSRVKSLSQLPDQPSEGEDEDDGIDTVLVLITHGAGCNALIGALSSQPVLLDVGMASLTMAVRRDIVARHDETDEKRAPDYSRKSSIDLALSDDYEITLIASTEHLRAGSTPLTIPQLQPPSQNKLSLKTATPSISSYRHRWTSSSISPSDGFSFGDPTPGAGLYRASIVATRPSPMNAASFSGLWGTKSSAAAAADTEDDLVPNFEDPSSVSPRASTPSKDQIKSSEAPVNKPLEGTGSQQGLWGGVNVAQERGNAGVSKRRWTVADRHE